MIAESKTERRRRRILRVDGGEICLMISFEFFVMRNVTAVTIHFPAFREGAQRNPGIVLNDDATVLQKEIAHTGESIAVHQEGSGFEQTQTGPVRGAPAEKGAVSPR